MLAERDDSAENDTTENDLEIGIEEAKLIIEGLLTTKTATGHPHVAPMGPVVDEQLVSWTLRPFETSTTFKLLREHPQAIFHVVDDVLPIAQAALGLPVELPFEQHGSGDWIIASCCHWYQLEIVEWKGISARTEATARVVASGIKRPFWGWNRAKHAVLEGAILATRLHLADRHAIADDLARLQNAIDKTAGDREREAWKIVTDFINRS